MSPNDPPIKILRIPANGSPMKIVKIKTKNITADPDTSNAYNLGHLPDVSGYWGYMPHEWARKVVCLFQLGDDPANPQAFDEGVFFLLKTLPLERNLSLNMNENWSHIENRRVWGDAFLCKLGKHAIVNGRANYVNMEEEMIDSDELKEIMARTAVSGGSLIPLDDNKNYPPRTEPVSEEASGSNT